MPTDKFKEYLHEIAFALERAKHKVDENFNLMSEDQISARDIAQDSKDAIIDIKEAYSKLNEYVEVKKIGDNNE